MTLELNKDAFKILTNLMGYWKGDDLLSNPYRGATEQEVLNNIDDAKQYYFWIWKDFRDSFYSDHRYYPPEEWSELT